MIHLRSVLQLAPPFTLDGSSFVLPGTSEDDFRTALVSYIRSQASLDELTDIYWSSSEANATFPYMVISRLHQRTILITTKVYYRESSYQFTVLSDDDVQAETLGQVAYDVLLPLANTPSILFAEGYEMSRNPGMSRGPDSAAAGMVGGDRVWMFSFDYDFTQGLL